MLKSVPNGTGSFRQAPSTSGNLLLDTTYQTPANPVPAPRSPDKWHAYVNGGAAADGAAVIRKRKAEEAKFLEASRNTSPVADQSGSSRLVEVSPEKKSISGNAKLLIDLDMDAPDIVSVPHGGGTSSYATAASSKRKSTANANMSLLD